MGGVYVTRGGECTPISKPERMLIGTSGKLLKGVILFNIFSQTSGMKGVLTTSRSSDNVTSLGVVRKGATEGA